MRKLTGAVFQSLDGVMQAPGGPEEDPTSDFRFGGWVQPLWGADMGPFEDVIMGEYDLLWQAHLRYLRRLLAVQSGQSDRG